MTDIAIHVDGLGKKYQIGARQVNKNIREGLTDLMAWPVRTARNLLHRRQLAADEAVANTLWALKDVTFDIRRGEVVGIIGRNGAGKSTLLKILARITKPTTGYADVQGKVGSLLEVGTGFHPELTGRENIYLNGAILGMKRDEVLRKFDEIVAFSEIDRFIDTPVKHYSSGMYVRLAFAVAAYLQPDILFVDEVLAVGDASFQKKCLGRMETVAAEGRTVIFVSHNMQAIGRLCSRCLLLDGGKLLMDGLPSTVINEYMLPSLQSLAEIKWLPSEAPGSEIVKLLAVRTLDSLGRPSSQYRIEQQVTLELEFECLRDSVRLNPAIHLYSSQGVMLLGSANYHDPEWGQHVYRTGKYQLTCRIPANFLNSGHYIVTVMLTRDLFWPEVNLPELISFEVIDAGGSMDRGDYVGDWIGLLRYPLPWTGCELQEAQL